MRLTKVLAVLLFVAGFALTLPAPVAVPELDPASAVSAGMLIAGAVLVVRANRRK